MKLLAKVFCSVALVSLFAGCASNDSVYIPKVPTGVKQALMDYEKLPDNKVFILAVDPGGDFAYAFEGGQATLKDAAKVAVEKVEAACEANNVLSRPYVYALNDKVVWADTIAAAGKAPAEKTEKAASGQDASDDNAEAENM
ncbi:hypothetical protein [Pontiella agarivorans]|uniref:Lipoprotein n=1 Tax=Pontiella agarivorans TaxID=3038953 RepID=A0ABU5MYJ6_9BACT|nr:hypothetical protein [Pontiella agarivorans]MDZ8119161.1 hypothetical protein [Pontiella agarivorans]